MRDEDQFLFLLSQGGLESLESENGREERERDIELMPPPSSHKKNTLAPMDVDQSDPNEPTYCICHQVCFIIIFLKRGLFYNIYQFFKFINYSFFMS